jgi:hypothetical protein
MSERHVPLSTQPINLIRRHDMKKTQSAGFARVATALVLSGTMMSALAWTEGRFTGGGSIYCPAPVYRVTFGYELHCQPDGGAVPTPNNLEINFSQGDHFHMTSLDMAECGGPSTGSPPAPFNTIDGIGTGTFNGEPATVSFRLTDIAEPGAGQDTARFTITTASGPVLACGPLVLEGGNNQAHRVTGRRR